MTIYIFHRLIMGKVETDILSVSMWIFGHFSSPQCFSSCCLYTFYFSKEGHCVNVNYISLFINYVLIQLDDNSGCYGSVKLPLTYNGKIGKDLGQCPIFCPKFESLYLRFCVTDNCIFLFE